MTTIHRGHESARLTDADVRAVLAQASEDLQPTGKRILVVIPDLTRSAPIPMMTREIHAALAGPAESLDFLIALGTHPALTDEQIDRLVGVPTGRREEVFGDSRFFNHQWDNPSALATIGTLSEQKVQEITGGLFRMRVDVTINRMVLDYDLVLICGPVFPHEVVGFSGGAKYFFPGICGEALLNFFHWLGAVITCPKIIGNKYTPVRKLLHAALDMVPTPSRALCMVVRGEDLAGLSYGTVPGAWSEAADLSACVHVTYVDAPFQSVLSRAPEMYDELWVGAKCMYKLEPVVADGGELIIYAPHIREISLTHGPLIEEIGYHTRDYFLGQWDRFQHYPWGVVAHSTHVRGIGAWADGVETPRINVTLATGIPEELCRRVNLGYRDPASIDVAQWQGREAEGRLYVPKAGEMLYKLRQGPAWQTADEED